MTSPVWIPTVPHDQIPMNIYRAHVNKKFNQDLRSSQELHHWSIRNLQDFWMDLHSYTGIIPPLPPTITKAFDAKVPMENVPEFFRGATVNYAENVISGRDPTKTALVGIREGHGLSGEVWTWGLLWENVRKARSALLQTGIQEGDRVAAIISTSVWSVGLFLATASIGAIWTSIAPDLGDEGCISRLRQVKPSLLFADAESTYKGTMRSNVLKIQNIVKAIQVRPMVFLIPISGADEAKSKFDLSSLKMVQTGGSHLGKDQYHWFYRTFPLHVHLTSVTGGTDLVTSWIGTDPAGPVYPGEIQLPMLGQDVDVVDPITGESIKHTGGHGEFVCRQPFPSMPVFFWGDEDGSKYKTTYFAKFPNFWAQHDWASYNPHTMGWQIHGRSDGVLNPQGIRFGSSDIYSITESALFNKVVSVTLCVGRRRSQDSDEAVFLFVVMQANQSFTSQIEYEIKNAIRKGLSSKHVPRFIIGVKEVPMTVNGKKIETLVKQVVSTGYLPKTISSTVANPECLEHFRQYYNMEVVNKDRSRL
ncbi:hypothetical protein N7466_003607 [Penicillium verhagenii]|uniref:uncharacterized protein n=1 Tax=Penicillium verhagenii TaxID=1562060 RepID=UPI002545439A|nr:uncharacterized protein N7466_003607 [Penicillium verhagenii]KAJ5934060.1 hypothetical protein N7466_003607 [Penicillium verhagenii]